MNHAGINLCYFWNQSYKWCNLIAKTLSALNAKIRKALFPTNLTRWNNSFQFKKKKKKVHSWYLERKRCKGFVTTNQKSSSRQREIQIWNRNFDRIWRDQWKVSIWQLLIVFRLEFIWPTVSRVNRKVKSGIFNYLFRNYFMYENTYKNFGIVYNYSCPKIKQKQKLYKFIFIFRLFFFSSSTKYSYCKSENPAVQLQFLLESPKLFDSIDFSTFFSQE